VAQHHHRPLPPRKMTDRDPQVLGIGRLLVARPPPPFTTKLSRRLTMPTSTPTGRGRGDHDPADIRLGILDPPPGESRLQQRGLQQILGQPLVLDQQVRRAQQRRGTTLHECVEVRLVAHAIPPFGPAIHDAPGDSLPRRVGSPKTLPRPQRPLNFIPLPRRNPWAADSRHGWGPTGLSTERNAGLLVGRVREPHALLVEPSSLSHTLPR